MQPARVREIVLDAVRTANQERAPEDQLDLAPEAPLFGPGSRLDSMGLVVLLVDIEEALHAEGLDVTLGDEKAVSRTRSPFRNIETLVAYITALSSTET